MHFNNKKNSSYSIAATTPLIATLFTLAIIVVAVSSMATPVAASTMTTATTNSPSGLELSPEPVHQERQVIVSENPINETHIEFTFTGEGTVSLPNAIEPVNITSTGSVVAAMDGTAIGKEVISTLDGTESATATFYAINRVSMEEDTGKAIVMALVHTNSTGQLAPPSGAIVAGEIEFLPDGTSYLTLWEWQSGIPLPTSTSTTMEESPAASPMNTTTTASESNATATQSEGETIEEEAVGGAQVAE